MICYLLIRQRSYAGTSAQFINRNIQVFIRYRPMTFHQRFCINQINLSQTKYRIICRFFFIFCTGTHEFLHTITSETNSPRKFNNCSRCSDVRVHTIITVLELVSHIMISFKLLVTGNRKSICTYKHIYKLTGRIYIR